MATLKDYASNMSWKAPTPTSLSTPSGGFTPYVPMSYAPTGSVLGSSTSKVNSSPVSTPNMSVPTAQQKKDLEDRIRKSDPNYISNNDRLSAAGINPNDKSKLFKEAGVDTTDDLLKWYQEKTNAEIEYEKGVYDKNKEDLLSQQDYLGKQKESSLKEAEIAYTDYENEIDKQTEAATQTGDRETASALQTAKETMRSVRNSLRALGILASSAAGELLSRPLNEFSKQKADISQQVVTRIQDLEDKLGSALKSYGVTKQKINDNYGQLVQQIKSDIRFNEFEKASAIRQAQAALNLKMAEITQAVAQYGAEVGSMASGLNEQLSGLQEFDAQANPGAIQATANFTSNQQTQTPGITQESGGFLSNLFKKRESQGSW